MSSKVMKVNILKKIIGIFLSMILILNFIVVLWFYIINLPIEGRVGEYDYNLLEITTEEVNNFKTFIDKKSSVDIRIDLLLNKKMGITEKLLVEDNYGKTAEIIKKDFNFKGLWRYMCNYQYKTAENI